MRRKIPTPQLSTLFSFSLKQLAARLTGLFSTDVRMTSYLFGFTPFALRVYLAVLGAIHLAGFLAAPAVAWLEQGRGKLRLLAVLNLGIAIMYVVAADNLIVTQWPQRILTFYSPFTFAGGVILPWHLFLRWRRRRRSVPVAAPPGWFLPP
jgi:hypothetical protein